MSTAARRQRTRSPAAHVADTSTPAPAPAARGFSPAFAISFADTLAVGLLNPITHKLVRSDLIGATGFGILLSASNLAALLSSLPIGRILG